MREKIISFPPPPTGIGIDGTGSYMTVTPPIHVGRKGRPVFWALAVLSVALMTEYRLRAGISATVPELASYLTILAGFYVRPYAPVDGFTRRLWFLFVVLFALMLLRAFYFKLNCIGDSESPFSRVRDTMAPLLIVLLLQTRVRLRGDTLVLLQWVIVGAGVVAGVIGICQFFFDWPFFYEGIEWNRYKSQLAQTYLIAQIFDLKVKQVARGIYGFSISYAASLVVPCLLAFALTLRGTTRSRLIAALSCLVIYGGIYVSFTRSIVTIVPFACFLVLRAMEGKLRPLTCIFVAVSYVAIAFFLPLLHLSYFDDSDLGTLSSRADTVAGYFRQLRRDPSILYFGSTHDAWNQYEPLAPHNWIAFALLTDGVPATLTRLGFFIILMAMYFPVRRSESGLLLRPAPLQAGMWCGAFTLLAVVGETEPFSGISEYLTVGCSLGILAVAQRQPLRVRRLLQLHAQPLAPVRY